MKQLVVLGMAAILLAGCVRASGPGTGPIAIEGDSITYETSPCFGACPAYSVTVRPDGSGVFNGKRFTAVTGEQAFTLTRAQYDAFAAQLAPYRPDSGQVRYAPGKPRCRMAATDMPSADIIWTGAIGDIQRLYYYFGCDRDTNRAMADAIGNAPSALPIEKLIGAHP